MEQADIGLIGLAVMGQNLILNMNDHGFTVAAFNRTVSKVDDFLAHEAKGTKIIGTHSIEQLMGCLKKPRRVVLLVKAGKAVDDFIEQILPYTEEGDIIIDGGNSNFGDSIRRTKYLEEKKRLFIGTGVSGGEEGARHGPSIMPGGSSAAWPHVKEIMQSISAKAGADEPCCQWVGATGAGHYVKMVHNGIEYGDMQLICEAYHLMKDALGMSCDEMGDVFTEWNTGELDSYLVEITAQILKFKDSDGSPLVEKIRDTAGQKGTGKWTGIEALEQGMPVTLIGEAVFARCLSALKSQREYASTILGNGDTGIQKLSLGPEEKKVFVDAIKKALLASKIVSYAQGFMLMTEAAKMYDWQLNFGEISLMWRGGCIIRSVFLGKIKEAFDADKDLSNLLLAPYFVKTMKECESAWRQVVSQAVLIGLPTPAFSTALAFYDGFRCKRLPANLLQAQRDYFGAHTFERLDAPGTWEHANWTGSTGRVTASTYLA
jgi:6-phosphogluconate dehydrogenase